jgi:CubicO group peptidase (beta-lactamase class C family)
MRLRRASTVAYLGAVAAVCVLTATQPLAQTQYFPPAGTWARKAPADVGMDAAKLDAAIAFAKAHETNMPKDFSTQEKIFGSLLGPIPNDRAATNGVIIRRGYVVAEFGETNRADPTYSVAKSLLSTVAGVAVREGLIRDLDSPVGALVRDGGYETPHNAAITWIHHLQQESEWEGDMWGKKDDFVGTVAFGDGERQPRELQRPGSFYEYNDVRINRLSLSLLRLYKKPIPEVFRDEIGSVIGMSSTWQWIPYKNASIEIDGKRLPSVSGGTRWGGGVWINSWDMARFGYLWLRGGRWGDKQIVPADYVKAALAPSAHGPDYGYLWWLNTQQKNMPGLPPTAYAARGAGNNTIVVSPEHDLVIVWRWHSAAQQADSTFYKMVIDSISATSQHE